MTYDPVKHAELLVDYCVSAQPGERILVAASTLALPLVSAVHDTLLARGAMPIVRLEYPTQLDDFLRLAPEALIANLHPVQLAEVESLDGSIRVLTPTPPADVDPARSALYRRTLAPVARERAKRKWNLSLFPTPYGAEASGMTLDAYEAFVANAMFLGDADPVARWGEVRAMQANLIERLSTADEVRIEAAGTDLTLSVRGRVWANSDGKRNMPSGEVFTGPVETSANGVIRYDLATMYAGREVNGIELEFRDGLVVRASADVGDDVLQAALSTDEGARRLGELGIGTNFGIQSASKNILFDEKIGGTVHLALGNAYPETLGTNASALHWDMICDLRGGGRISLDGEVFQENGRFV